MREHLMPLDREYHELHAASSNNTGVEVEYRSVVDVAESYLPQLQRWHLRVLSLRQKHDRVN